MFETLSASPRDSLVVTEPSRADHCQVDQERQVCSSSASLLSITDSNNNSKKSCQATYICFPPVKCTCSRLEALYMRTFSRVPPHHQLAYLQRHPGRVRHQWCLMQAVEVGTVGRLECSTAVRIGEGSRLNRPARMLCLEGLLRLFDRLGGCRGLEIL